MELDPPALDRPTAPAPTTDMAVDPGPAVLVQRVDITLSDGRRILVEGATALPAIVVLVEGLAQ